jgi:3-oxoacyl-[acyl-carrier protein] reductase
MLVDWAGQDVVVTGAGRGLGKGVALGFARAGATVWMCADHEEELRNVAVEVAAAGGTPRVLSVDLADPDGCAEVVRWIAADARDLRALVNNAAVLSITPVRDLSFEEWNRTLAINLSAPFLLARDLLRHLSAEGGSIINVSSMAGVRATAGEAAYCASKFGIEGLSRSMALDLSHQPISVNTITPGLGIKPTSLTESEAARVPLEDRARWNDPEILAPAFLFLASLRGQVTGRRFDARVLTEALESWGPGKVLSRIDDVAVS